MAAVVAPAPVAAAPVAAAPVVVVAPAAAAAATATATTAAGAVPAPKSWVDTFKDGFGDAWGAVQRGFEQGRVPVNEVSMWWATPGVFPIWQLVVIVLAVVVAYYWYWGMLRVLETPTNIARILKENVKAAEHYSTDAVKRKGLPELYKKLIADGNTDEELCFTNFYVNTVNATGLFYPAVDGIISPDAARLATLAGARAFVFDIWPDLTPGGDFGPTLEVMDIGSFWRRTTLNALPLVTILQSVVQTALPSVGTIFNSTSPGTLSSQPVLYFKTTPQQVVEYNPDLSFASAKGFVLNPVDGNTQFLFNKNTMTPEQLTRFKKIQSTINQYQVVLSSPNGYSQTFDIVVLQFLEAYNVITLKGTPTRVPMPGKDTLMFAIQTKPALANPTLPGPPVAGQGQQDPVILYLRFRGVPREETFDQVADVLASTILPYRLEAAFNNCRGADRLFRIPISRLFSKVIVVSNTRGSGQFSEFVNFGPTTNNSGIPLEYEATGLPLIVGDYERDSKIKIMKNLSFVAPLPETPVAESNDYNQAKAQSLGIHCIGMNMFKDGKPLQTYLSNDMFGTYSYSLKPRDLCYIPQHLTPPRQPPNPNWGDNSQGQAGNLRAPAAIRTP